MIAYNMSADSVVWQQTNFDSDGIGTVWAPVVYNNYVFYQGANSIFCFNKTNGQLLWNWLAPTGDDLIFSKLIVREGYLYIMTSLGGIYALNYSTGGTRWSNVSIPGEPSQLAYFEKTLYLTSAGTGLLYAIDGTNGTVLWTLESPNSANPDTFDARFENAPTIDPVTHRLYITDGYYLICYSLN
jgi:outer membrane protein assembly factor BamB